LEERGRGGLCGDKPLFVSLKKQGKVLKGLFGPIS